MAKAGNPEREEVLQQVKRVVEAQDAWVKAQRGKKPLKRTDRLLMFEYDDARDDLNYHAILRLLQGH